MNAVPPMMPGYRAVLLIGALLLAGTMSGCATYSDSFGVIERNLSAQQYDTALQDIEKESGSKKDRVLYLLNKGMVLRMKRNFAGSNEAFEAAKTEMERLYAASVSENALSFVVNDATVSYTGEDYEQVLVHLYMALNYLELGQRDDARVEALQVDIKLREIAEKFPDNKFTEDALSHYLAGLVYDEKGEWSDAMISYRMAYEAYKNYQKEYGTPMPDMLKHDLLRLGQRQGLKDEVAQYSKEFGLDPATDAKPVPDQDGELVFVLNNGLAPIKRERIVNVSAPSSTIVVDNTRQKKMAPPVMVTIALPYYQSRPNKVLSARVRVSGKQISTQLMENIDVIAKASLESHMAAITARSIARAVAKGAIQQSVDRAGERNKDPTAELIGSLFVRVASVVTERADTRSWLTLPANVQMARVTLPPGNYTVDVDMLGAGGQVISTREYPNIVVSQQHKTYLTEHWISH